jgi:hypothetical protein
LITQDGPISLQETSCTCSHCRRVFFPQQSSPTPESSPLQSGDADQGGLHGGRGPIVSGRREAPSNHHGSGHLSQASSEPRPRGRRRTRPGAA